MRSKKTDFLVCPECGGFGEEGPRLVWAMPDCGCLLGEGDIPGPECVNAWKCGKCDELYAERDDAKECCR